MRNAIRNQKSTVFGGFLLVVAEFKDGVLETGVHLVAEGVTLEEVIASTDVEGQFGSVYNLLADSSNHYEAY